MPGNGGIVDFSKIGGFAAEVIEILKVIFQISNVSGEVVEGGFFDLSIQKLGLVNRKFCNINYLFLLTI